MPPPCEKLLQRLRARVKNAGRESEESKQRSAPSGGDDVEARRLNKKRKIDEACMRFDEGTADTYSEEKAVDRISITKLLRGKAAEAQESNAITMHAIKNSKHLNSKTTMRGKYDDHGVGSDHRTMQGSTSSSKDRRNKDENEAIGRLLSSKNQ